MRNFLKNNKIYLDTINGVLLSIMAIMVSIKSCQIAERQYESEYLDKTPEFQIIESQIRNDSNGIYENTYLDITKVSGKAKNIETEIITFVNFELTDYNYNKKNKDFIVPDYYNTNFLTGKIDGEIQNSRGHRNNIQLANFLDSVDLYSKSHFEFLFSNKTHYVKIKYLNFENKIQTQFYKLDFINGNLIDSITGRKAFEKYNNLFKKETIIELNNHPINYSHFIHYLKK